MANLVYETLYRDVVGQEHALAALAAAARQPVHAYLFVGPAGSGKRAAALGFAAALLCPSTESTGEADGTCDSCRRVLAGVHPDVEVVEREGAAISIEAARAVIHSALTSPVEGRRKVLVLADFHLVSHTGPALLKTIEEPPPSTIFVVLAEFLPPELVTIASRCVRVDFHPLGPGTIEAALVSDGVPAERAAVLAQAAGGRLDRARLLAGDSQFEARRQAWRDVIGQLDGRGATIASLADRLVGYLDQSAEPLKARQAEEMADLVARNERAAQVVGSGRPGRAGARASKAAQSAGVRDLEERQKRAARRQRTDELRSGLGALAGAYRDRLATASDRGRQRAAIQAVGHIDRMAADLVYNPGDLLALQALLIGLDRVGRGG